MAWKNTYALDEDLAFNTGFKVEFYDAQGNVVNWVKVKYAGPSNKKFTAFRNVFMKPYERKMAQGSMSETESDKHLQECFIKGGIVTEWSDDRPITVENFRDAMEEAPPETWRDIMTSAFNPKFFAPITVDETGN